MRRPIVYEVFAASPRQIDAIPRKIRRSTRGDALARRSRVLEIVADRFVRAGSGWVDLASGALVRLHVAAAGTVREQVAWADRCGTLARLRHPLLAPLVDYGTIGQARRFEAYVATTPLRGAGQFATRTLRHAVRFLESYGIPLTRTLAPLVLRAIEAGPCPRGRPVGILIQRRRALDVIADALRAAAPGGVTAIDVHGGRGSGLRTLQLLAAREARLQGYAPVSSAILARRPWLTAQLLERHVVLLTSDDAGPSERTRSAGFLVTLGRASTRRHVLLNFRAGAAPPSALRLDAMGVSAMQAMVHLDTECGPSAAEIVAAIRVACGSPGALIDTLGALQIQPLPARAGLLHETAPAYIVRPEHGLADAARRPLRRGLTNALARALRLARAGRHASAIRLLTRASRLLDARGRAESAAEVLIQLGFVVRERGHGGTALDAFERARALAAETPAAVRASAGIGIVLTDELRFGEAEALLRSACAAATMLEDRGAARASGLALARCLFWQQRAAEAASILEPWIAAGNDAEVLALAARVSVLSADHRRAAEAASRAVALAEVAADLRLVALSLRALALVRASVRDLLGVDEAVARGLRAAREAHLPLVAFRLRCLRLASLRFASGDCHSRQRGTAFRTPRALHLSGLLRRQLESARAIPPENGPASVEVNGSLAFLKDLLELVQTAPDDRTSVERVCEALSQRVRASAVAVYGPSADSPAILRCGRSAGSDHALAARALAAAAPTWSETEPFGHAAPVRYGAEIIGALTCRWIIGTAGERGAAAAACNAAALAIAASVRSLMDRRTTCEYEPAWGDLLGTSPAAAALRQAIVSAARAPFPVLIEGESGSGKELVARAIHRLSARKHRRVCTLNCAALSDELLEAELFGHSRGAFTGAMTERAGLFEEADGGTLFLDEVGELSARAQAKLLRALQDGEVRRVGENLPRRVDTRVVSATNRRLHEEVEAGRFRADLRFRLDVIRISVPPLRDRATDIPALASHFWQDAAARVGSHATLAPETLAALARCDWPGNVRELQNAMAALAVHGPRRGRITPAFLPSQLARVAAADAASFEAAREEFERRFVRAALARAGGQRTRAARALGVTRQGLAKMMKRLAIDAEPDAGKC